MRSARYVPDGSRSWGPVVAGMRHVGQPRLGRRPRRHDPDDRDRRSDRQPRRDPRRSPASTRSTSVRPTCRSASGSSRATTTASRSSTMPSPRSSPPASGTASCRGSTPRGVDRRRPPRAGLPHDHRHQRRARDASRVHQRTRAQPAARPQGDERQAVLTPCDSGSGARSAPKP